MGMSDPFVCLCVCMFTSYVSQLVVCLFVCLFGFFVCLFYGVIPHDSTYKSARQYKTPKEAKKKTRHQ